ncbi:MAG: tail fiber domain-containing protein, partial [Flavobacteriales bacterium]
LLDIDASALASNNKRGILIPRMTAAEMTAIPSPATGLLVFNTTANNFFYFNGTAWVAIGGAAGWGLIGNAGTTPASNFLGTTDNQVLRFRVNNQFAGQLSTANSAMLSLGLAAGVANTGLNNTFIGNGAGAANVASGSNTYVGANAGNANVTGAQNVYIGRLAGGNATAGSDNVLIGNGAGLFTTANNNVMIGSFAGNANVAGGGNTFIGTQAGQANNGGQNTFIGTGAGGTNSAGTQNTLIGNGAAVATANLTNATAIGRASRVDASDALVLGSVSGVNGATSTTNVGIGVNTPLDRLHVAGSIRMVDGNQALGRIPVSDANGTATWVDPLTVATSLTWTLTGNAGTNPANNFLGTTDFQSLRFRTGNLERMSITAAGLVGVRITTPMAPLHVAAFGTLSGVGGFTDAVIRGESNTNAFVYLCTPNVGQSGILFGTPAQPFGAGMDYGIVGTGDLGFRVNNTFAMMIDGPTGNVGIGSSTPDEHLEVEGLAEQYLRISSASGTSGVAGIEFKRSGTGASDWQVRNEGGLLLFGQSADDLATVSDVLRLGGGSVTPAADNAITLGQAGLRWTNVFATSGVVNTSDAREKKDIRPLNYGLAEVLKLKPVRFRWKNNPVDGDKLGLIAQDLQLVLPETVVDKAWQTNEEGSHTQVPAERLGVYYSDIIPVLIKAIQEQQQEIEGLRTEVELLKTR